MAGNHPRNTGPMLSSRRCGAKTRSGDPCMSPAVTGKRRCRMHGGAAGSGAPRGNKNALKRGRYTREAIEECRQLRALLRQSRMLFQRIDMIGPDSRSRASGRSLSLCSPRYRTACEIWRNWLRFVNASFVKSLTMTIEIHLPRGTRN